MSLYSTLTRRFDPVPFTQVSIEDQFWAPRMRTNRERTIPHITRMLRETGRIDAFRMKRKPSANGAGIFGDSDVAKWLEGVCYDLAIQPDSELTRTVDDVAGLIASAQQPDGYLNTYFTLLAPDKRWTNLRSYHELYCAGHLLEAALAHHQVTGNRLLLDAMVKNVGHFASLFGPARGQKRGYCGHPEIELALVKLYRATGEERYLQLSQYFVDERGRTPHYFDIEAKARGEEPRSGKYDDDDYQYFQAHLPVREQTEAVGHAVRAMYLYSAMADLALESGDEERGT